MSYLNTDEAYEYSDLACWYQNSIDETQPPIWTDEHLDELLKDFYVIPKDTPTADVVPKSEVERLEAEVERLKHILDCYALQYGTVKEQQAVIDKANQEFASEIFAEVEKIMEMLIYDYKKVSRYQDGDTVWYVKDFLLAELKNKYTEGEE